MTLADLQNFFVMHGENVERKQGSPGAAGSVRESRPRSESPRVCGSQQCATASARLSS